jgi:hypothetical protein
VTQNSASTTPPTITIAGDNPAIIHIGQISGKRTRAVLSQLRNIDSRRLYQKISTVSAEQLVQIKFDPLRVHTVGAVI